MRCVGFLATSLILLGTQVKTGVAMQLVDAVDDKATESLIDIATVDPSIHVDLRYFSRENFVGRTIAGYYANKCLLTRSAAEALAAAQSKLREMKLSLKLYDCYRPQEAVNDFIAWSKSSEIPKNKLTYFQFEERSRLFERGYISEKSGHSRGSTVDVTIEPIEARRNAKQNVSTPCFKVKGTYDKDGSLNMGTSFDCFDERSHTASSLTSAQARANRQLLKLVMEQSGFKNYDKEWWHFTLVKEPFPETYFTEPVR